MNNRYAIYSKRTKDYTTSYIEGAIYQIFDDELAGFLKRGISFELGKERLIQPKNRLRDFILSLLPERGKDISHIPPNYEERRILDQILKLNMRDTIDEKLFWYGGIYRLMEDAVIHDYDLKFIFDDGKKHVDYAAFNIEVKVR